MKRISFIHAADLHLDSPMVGLKHLPKHIFTRVKESTFTALKKITAAAIRQQVDFVILAGDLYDGEDRSLRAQSRFRLEMQKLADQDIPVYVIHGNHDHLNGSWVNLDMPANVHVFNGEVETMIVHTKCGEIVHLYGFSYPARHVFERKIDDYIKTPGADFHIGILHGNETGRTDHDNYAPFSTKDLLQKDMDYWALGHIHKRTILSEHPAIIYPGNIQGRNKKETGKKGFYHVVLSEQETKLTFLESADIVWEETIVDAHNAGSFQDVLHLCQTAIQQSRKEGKGTILSITLKNLKLEDSLEKRKLEGELLELLQEAEMDEQSFVWPAELSFSERSQPDKTKMIAGANFFGELFETIENYNDPDTPLAPLYGHHLGRKYLSLIPEKEKQELIAKAENLLIDLLHQS